MGNGKVRRTRRSAGKPRVGRGSNSATRRRRRPRSGGRHSNSLRGLRDCRTIPGALAEVDSRPRPAPRRHRRPAELEAAAQEADPRVKTRLLLHLAERPAVHFGLARTRRWTAHRSQAGAGEGVRGLRRQEIDRRIGKGRVLPVGASGPSRHTLGPLHEVERGGPRSTRTGSARAVSTSPPVTRGPGGGLEGNGTPRSAGDPVTPNHAQLFKLANVLGSPA